jgi:transcriptional regulator with XRE-family HTH domain
MDESADLERVAEHLRRVLRERKMSLREAEDALEMGRDYLSQLLRGAVDLKLKHVYALLKIAGKDPSAFWREVHPDGDRLEQVVAKAVEAALARSPNSAGAKRRHRRNDS